MNIDLPKIQLNAQYVQEEQSISPIVGFVLRRVKWCKEKPQSESIFCELPDGPDKKKTWGDIGIAPYSIFGTGDTGVSTTASEINTELSGI